MESISSSFVPDDIPNFISSKDYSSNHLKPQSEEIYYISLNQDKKYYAYIYIN